MGLALSSAGIERYLAFLEMYRLHRQENENQSE